MKHVGRSRRIVGRGDRGEKAHVAPGEHALGEGPLETGKILQPLRHPRELLQLAARESEALPGVVVEPGEPEAAVRAPQEEGPGQAAEHAAAERFLTRQAAEEAIEQLGAKPAIEPPPLLG